MPREIKNINFNDGYNSCEARMQILKNETVRSDLDEYKLISSKDVGTESFLFVDNNGEPSKLSVASIIDPKQGVQADWAEKDETSLAFIKNKPNFTLEDDLVASYTLGGIKRGTTIKKGSSALDILTLMFTSNENVIFKFGALSSIDSIRPNLVPDLEVMSVDEVLTSGLTIKNVSLNNEYYVLLVPDDSRLVVDAVFQSGYRLSTKSRKILGYTAYYQDVPSTGTYTFRYMFIQKDE